MVLNTILAGAAILLLMLITAQGSRLAGAGSIGTFIVQSISIPIAVYVMFHFNFIGLFVAVTLAIMPVTLRIIVIGWFVLVGYAATKGQLGEETQWAATLIQNGDEEFEQAMLRLDRMDKQQIGMIAESKEELRELTLEWAEEK